jgi:tetratricopeptide (TPR) repeat protein
MNASTQLRPLVLAVCTVLSIAIAAPVFAQDQSGNTGTSMREQRAKRMKELGKGDDAKKTDDSAQLYPNATRKSPEAMAKGKNLKALQDLQAAYEKQQYAEVIAQANTIAANSESNPYEKSFAYQLAGASSSELGEEAKAGEYFKKAVDTDGLDNNSHYQAMYNLAVIEYGEGKNAEALATLDRFMSETKSSTPDQVNLRAALLANLGRNDEAAKAFTVQLAANPNDKKALMNAVATYQAANQDDKANALLEDAYKKGMLTDEKELRALYAGYMNAERYKDAQKVIEDGVAKGVLKDGPDLAKAYMILGQNAYFSGSDSEAIAFYSKAAPMAPDGEAYLNMAKILRDQGKTADAKAAAQKALDKGIKKPAEAKEIIAN